MKKKTLHYFKMKVVLQAEIVLPSEKTMNTMSTLLTTLQPL